MATEFATVEIWVVVDENGDYDVGNDIDTASERFNDTVGFEKQTGTRQVKITLKVPLPTVLEVSGEVAVSEECGELKAV